MKRIHFNFGKFLIFAVMLSSCQQAPQPVDFPDFESYPVYDGQDLGVTYSKNESMFKLWSPTAEEAALRLYQAGSGGAPDATFSMQRADNGVWQQTVEGDLHGHYYTLQVKIKGKWLNETTDPYARAAGVNGLRGMVTAPDKSDPEGWENDQRPAFGQPTDAVIYELNIRDLSAYPESGIQNKGKYAGLAETGTKGPKGVSTGLDHIKSLGVTHVHLLPFFDFRSLDESKPEDQRYNWGYDPQHYNVPEGSFSSDPNNGLTRILEVKSMIKTLHENGIRVIMDAVYNHTGATEDSNFNQLVPGYYYRQNADGGFSNASACGNETASERAMMRKFIIESVTYWARAYHIDGFRFDLMGIHDIETMNLIRRALDRIDPTILMYGEGWTAGASPLPDSLRALKANTYKLDGIAAFSDDIRDAIKGHVFTPTQKGFVSGKKGLEESVKFGVTASTMHPQVNYDSVNYSRSPWAAEPAQTITYVSCHDNHTLWDRLAVSAPEASEADRIKMQKLAGAIVLCSQGISFLHAGVEMLRTKNGVENSFESPVEVNWLDWSRKAQYPDVFAYFQDLIRMRRSHPAFRMPTSEMIRTNLRFLENTGQSTVAFTISNHANGDTWKDILVVFNGNDHPAVIGLPEGQWTVMLNDRGLNEKGWDKVTRKITVSPYSALVLAAVE